MTMHTIFSKGNEGVVHNHVATLSTAAAPWRSGLVPQSVAYAEPFGQLKSASVEQPNSGNHVTATKQAELPKGNASEFTIFSGDCKSPANGQNFSNIQTATSGQSANMDYRGHFEIGFGRPLISAKYPYGEQCVGLFSAYGPQVSGRIMLPLNLTADEGPIFVNAKQYHGILRRRKSRAKEMEKKALNPRKPYLHLSRHLHAMRRPRGCGGRFLNTRNMNGSTKGRNTNGSTKGGKIADTCKTGEGQNFYPPGSPNSEVLQSDSSTLNSPKETTGSRSCNSSEVTNVFSRGNLDPFSFQHLRPSVQAIPNMMISGHGFLMAGKWVCAADGCCNLKV